MKIGLISLGCPKNLVDSEVMLGLAHHAGHELTRDAGEADVLIVNTCAFIDKAKQESIDTILEMAEHKKTGACQRLVVTGCLAERYRDELREQIPEIDAVLGTGDVPDIVAALGGSALGGSTPGEAAAPRRTLVPLLRADGSEVSLDRRSPLPTYLYSADTPRMLATPRHYAYIKIGEGCDYRCAFCIIPTLRGDYRSRTIESVVREAHALAAQGVKEILLVSQDTSYFGIDRGERGALSRLLGALQAVDGIEWIRLLYLYPTTITDDVLDAMAEHSKVCRYVDLPLQHASDAVLKRMRRPGTRAGYERLLARIRDRVPGVTLRTTFIVGFPGETEADVVALAEFVDAMRFNHVGVFTYSHEEGTPAFAFEDDVPAEVKRDRQASIMAIQRGIVARANKDRIGRTVRLLVDGPSTDHALVLRARMEGQAPDIDSEVYLTECDPADFSAGQFIDAEILAPFESSLDGSPGAALGDHAAYDLLARPLAARQPA
jgi:ribosomal protein S12 methylthiotransferase